MADSAFKPVFYLLNGCPFCLKVRIHLLESGLDRNAEFRNFDRGSPEEQAVRDELSPHFEKVSLPSAQVAPGEYINDSDAIIARMGQPTGPVLNLYANGVFQRIGMLFRENMELKKQLEQQ